MTCHRWRRLCRARHDHDPVGIETHVLVGKAVSQSDIAGEKRIDEVRNENERLPQIALDLLLEKVRLEEQIANASYGRIFKRV
jgi:hypothetical protein